MLNLFVLMLMTFILASCGGGKSQATLSVSRGFVMGNTSFSGGIYISGTKTDGSESFLATIAAGNTANVSITFGTWDIKVVGWDGAGIMDGTPYCGYNGSFNFTTEGQTLLVHTTNANCFATTISGTNQQISGAWKSLVINSCGAMFNPSYSNMLYPAGYFNPCTDVNYPVEYRRTFPYYKLVLYNQTTTGTRAPVLSSNCLTAQSPQTVKFPNRMPVTVEFYKDSTCTRPADSYIFKAGLDESLANRSTDGFDYVVTADTASYFVTVASGASKRGTTAFHTETPKFMCQVSGKLVPCPKLPATTINNFYVDLDTYAVIKVLETTCGSIVGGGGVNLTVYSCDAKDGYIYIGLKATNTTPITGSIVVNGLSHPLTVGNPNTAFSDDTVRDTFKTLKRVLGYQNASNLNDSLADDFDEGDGLEFGFLNSPFYDISAMGAGGVFYSMYTQCTVSPLAQVFGSYQKDGFTYNVALSGISGTSPGFTTRSAQPEWMTPEIRYNRRLIVRKILGPTYTTEKVIDFSCDNFHTDDVSYTPTSPQVRTGKMEEQREYMVGPKLVKLKKIVFWNTSTSNASRFDVYRYKKVTLDGTTQKIETNFYRATKALTDDYNDFKIKALTYEAVRDNSSSYDESLLESEIDSSVISSQSTYAYKKLFSLKLENTTGVGTIFSNGLYTSELSKVRNGYLPLLSEEAQPKVSSTLTDFVEAQPEASLIKIRYTDGGLINSYTDVVTSELIATDISPDGSKKAVAVSEAGNIHVYITDSGAVNDAMVSIGSTALNLKVSVMDDGSYLLAYILEGTNDTLHWALGNLAGIGAVSSGPYTSYSTYALELSKDATHHYLLASRGDGTTQYVDVCRVNASTSCGFNLVASRVSASKFMAPSISVMASTAYSSYLHDGVLKLQPFTINASNVISPGALMDFGVSSFRPYTSHQYTYADESAALRISPISDFNVSYPFYLPTLGTFEMKLMYLKESTVDALFSPSFTSQVN